MSKRIEKELKHMAGMLKESVEMDILRISRISSIEDKSKCIDITDKCHIEKLIKDRFGGLSPIESMRALRRLNCAKDFESLMFECIRLDMISSRGVKPMVDKVKVIEGRSLSLKERGKKSGDLMMSALKIAMKASAYGVMCCDSVTIHQSFAMMFKAAYTLLNSNIDISNIDDFYERTALIMCAGMKRPSKFHHDEMTPVEKYEDLFYYRISDDIRESRDYLRNYIKEYYTKFTITPLNVYYVICSDFMWDLLTKYKKQ